MMQQFGDLRAAGSVPSPCMLGAEGTPPGPGSAQPEPPDTIFQESLFTFFADLPSYLKMNEVHVIIGLTFTSSRLV